MSLKAPLTAIGQEGGSVAVISSTRKLALDIVLAMNLLISYVE
jgi:hypothetical protein